MAMEDARQGLEISIDLESQKITSADGQDVFTFDVDEFRRHCLMNGLDDIALTLEKEEEITKFEKQRASWL